MNSSIFKTPYALTKVFIISKILLTEHFRDPIAILWAGVAPCIMFTVLIQSNWMQAPQTLNYASSSAWFYSYIAANSALYGFSFYLIGRRESGFVRSFIYKPMAIKIFLHAHTVCYSLISLSYSTLFYLVTKPFYGAYSALELLQVTASFYTCYLLFSCAGLVIVAMPLKFNTANTLFSLLSFWMLLSGYMGSLQNPSPIKYLSTINPIYLTTMIFSGDIPLTFSFPIAVAGASTGLFLTWKFFRIQPIWSRY